MERFVKLFMMVTIAIVLVFSVYTMISQSREIAAYQSSIDNLSAENLRMEAETSRSMVVVGFEDFSNVVLIEDYTGNMYGFYPEDIADWRIGDVVTADFSGDEITEVRFAGNMANLWDVLDRASDL